MVILLVIILARSSPPGLRLPPAGYRMPIQALRILSAQMPAVQLPAARTPATRMPAVRIPADRMSAAKMPAARTVPAGAFGNGVHRAALIGPAPPVSPNRLARPRP